MGGGGGSWKGRDGSRGSSEGHEGKLHFRIAEGFMILGWSPQSRAGSGQAEGRADRAVEEGSQRVVEVL